MEQLYRKQGQSQVVDSQGNLRNFTGNLDSLPIYNSNSITSGDLKQPQTPNLGNFTPQIPNIAGDISFFNQLQGQQTAEQQRLAQERDAGNLNIENLLKDISGRGIEQLSLEQQYVDPLQSQLSKLTGDIGAQIAEYQQAQNLYEKAKSDIEAGAGRKGITTSAVMGQQGAIDRAKASELNVKASGIALLQAQAQALQGNIELAQRQVDRAVDLKYSGKEQELIIRKFQLDNIKELLSSEEKKQANALNFALDKEEKRLAEQKENEKTIENMLIQASINRTPNSVLAKAQEIAKNGGKSSDVAKALGQYGMTLSDRLEIQLKEKQLAKLNSEITNSNPDAGELVKINGRDYIRYKDGTISEPVLPEASDIQTVASRIDNKLKTLGRLTKPSVGLATSAGSLRGAPIPFLAKGKINDWRADAVNIIQKLTVDELGRVKSDGVTFGALSNGERQAVGDAATALSAAMQYDGKGDDKRPNGKFKMSEKKVVEEFKKIYDGYALDFQRRTGVNYTDYLKNPSLTKNSAVDSFIDDTGSLLINNANYGNYQLN